MTGMTMPQHFFRDALLEARRFATLALGLVLLALPVASGAQTAPEGLTPIFSDGFESGNYFNWSKARTGSADETVPDLEISVPVATVLFNQNTTPVTVLFADADSGIALESLRIFVDSFRLDPDCVVSTDRAECQTPFLGAGSHELTASVWDQAGNRALVRHTFEVVIDTQPPLITITSPTDGGFLATTPVTVVGTVSDADIVASVEVNGAAAVLVGDAFSATVTLSEGENLIRVDAADRAGNAGATTILTELDTVAPELTLTEPIDGAWSNETTIRFAGNAQDQVSAVSLTIAGSPVALQEGEFEAQIPLVEGPNSIPVEVTDEAGNVTTSTVLVRRLTVSEITITSPTDGSLAATTSIDVLGTVSDLSAAVTVNGISAVVDASGAFTASSVPLSEGGTTLSAVATLPTGSQSSAKATVFRDSQPPRVMIYEPQDGDVLLMPEVDVLGLVTDTVLGTVGPAQVAVTVNAVAAEVSNRSFFLPSVVLQPGENLLTVVAEDASGNQASTSVTVFQEVPSEAWIGVEDGNHQTAVIGAALAAPLQTRLLDGSGTPVAAENVVFSVEQGSGTLTGGGRAYVAVTDGAGIAQASFFLGSRSGVGNHRVEATAVGFAGRAVFLATALPDAPALVHVDSGGQQRGVTSQLLPDPLAVVVTDGGFNRLAGVPVLFEVAQGLGTFANGEGTMTVTTDGDGRAVVLYRLGSEEGISNEVVSAAVSGNPSIAPVTFVASALAAGDPAETRVSGLVLDNANNPVPGVTVELAGTGLTAQTDDSGLFSLEGAPVGSFHLEVDGTTTTLPGQWPHLEFELTTIPGRDNSLGMPSFLLPLDVARGLQVSETEGGILMLPELPGFSLEVGPGSVIFPGGGRSGTVSATLVHGDKVPMVPNFGQQPNFIVTIQPAGAVFDPPAKITLPNTDGLVPGEVTELYSFDHDLGQFVSIGPGSVSDDGTVVASDPGVGILKAGWHCGGNPASAGTTHNCPQCNVCNGISCVPGCPTSAFATVSVGTEGSPAEILGCSCDDSNPCTVDDDCNNGTCRGRPIRFDSVMVTANGQATPLEIEIDSSGGAAVLFEATVAPEDHGCGTITYEWQFGDGGFGSGQTASHTYLQDGLYLPKVSARCLQCPSVKRQGGTGVDAYEVQMLLEQDGDTEISTDGKFTEDTTIRVTAVKSTTGTPVFDFQGTVMIADESGFPLYEANDGELPESVVISFSGTNTFVAKSQVGVIDGGKPPDAEISVTNYPLLGGQPLSVEQWVDVRQIHGRSSGDVYDWLEARMKDIFETIGDVGDAAAALATVTHYELDDSPDVPDAAAYVEKVHVMEGPMFIVPFASDLLRVPGTVGQQACSSQPFDWLTTIVLHEARHGFVNFLTTIDLDAPDEIPGSPNNDDDQDFLVDIMVDATGPSSPVIDSTDVRLVCNQAANFTIPLAYRGDAMSDEMFANEFALEMDAILFAIRHAP